MGFRNSRNNREKKGMFLKNQPNPKIGTAEVLEASKIMKKYKEGKARLEAKIVANEEYWKLRQWNYIGENDSKEKKDIFQPASAWLWSCIQSRYSDAMDSYPTCNFQPRQADDKDEAKMLSNIVPVILEQNRYEEVYSDIVWYTLKHGGSVQGIFWDKNKHNGLGDIAIKKIDFLNLFWEPGITNIQDSQHVFNTELVDNKILEQRYPQCKGRLSRSNVTITKYMYDDKVDTSNKSLVVDWYYHTEYNGKKTLQYVKYVNDIVLYATENETEKPTHTELNERGEQYIKIIGESMAEKGLYDHALYPFVAMPLYPVEGSICGYGLTDIGKDTQNQIDVLSKCIIENAIVSIKPRYFKKGDGTINEEEYADVNNTFVHVEGNIDETYIRPIDTKGLDGIYVNVLNSKIDELKYITSNQDSNNGVAPSGVTAASAIAALQETAGKNARSSNKAFHRAYREVCYQVVELIRQFYDVPRTFRIYPDGVKEEFVSYSNVGIKPQKQSVMGVETGLRLPEFDIDVTSEKANPYKKMEMNELALSFYDAGLYEPQRAEQALACLNMMDFTKKEDVVNIISENATTQKMLVQFQQLALQLATKYDPMMADRIAQMILQSGQQFSQGSSGQARVTNVAAEHPYVKRARNQARQSTQTD